MYCVLLVDDEQIILNTLLTSIPWQQLGVDQVLTASDGNAALTLIRNSSVDLLISDIKMPHMDGLELLTHVRSEYPAIHCILLTAYGEFEYAKKAIELGVENYLLKPFKQNELESTIEKALDNIYRSRENNQDLFQNNILLRWATGNITSDELSERAPFFHLNPYLSNYRAVVIHRLTPQCSLSTFYSRCCARADFPKNSRSFWANREQLVLILSDTAEDAQLADLFKQTADSLHCTDQLLIAIGINVDCSEKLPKSYQSARQLLSSVSQTDQNANVLYHQKNRASDQTMLVHELIRAFQSENEEMRTQCFDSIFGFLEKYADRYADRFRLLLGNLILLFEQELPEQPQIPAQLNRRAQLLSSVETQTDFIQAANELLNCSYLLFRYYFEKFSPIIQYAVTYIHEHYGESLSIKEFCVKNKMNTAYFGYLFKKDTGMFFNNYLTSYRICSSLPLLLNTSKSVQEIAKEIGFSSPTYYISCFKKQTGLSPVKYRELKFETTK